MRTEHEMLDLVRAKLGRRRRRRRVAMASAGGGVAAALIVAMVLAGPGVDRAGIEVKAGPGRGPGSTTTATSSSTTTGPEDGGREEGATPPPSTPAGSGAAPPTSGAPSATDPDAPTGTVPAGPGPSTPTTAGPDPGDPPAPPATEPTVDPPGEPWQVRQSQTSAGDNLTLTAIVTSDPARPGVVSVRLLVDEPDGTIVHDGLRHGPNAAVRHRTMAPIYYWERTECSGHPAGPSTIEPAHLDGAIDVTAPSGELELYVEAWGYWCHGPDDPHVAFWITVQVP